MTLHSPSVMMHFLSSHAMNGNLDDWGQVQPQDPQVRPRVVHRGLEGLPQIPKGEGERTDHLVFVVHGIGSACDIKFRSITEVVDGFREMTEEMSDKHFQSARLAGQTNRIEYLPVNWHTTLHGEAMGTDNRLKPLTLKSIPKLRSFVNDTLLDVLFYTSPLYCQTILNTVVSEINRMYTLYMARNEQFNGSISVMGHSLGSLILFDILSNQVDNEEAEIKLRQKFHQEQNVKTSPQLESRLEDVFTHLSISEHTAAFVNEGIELTSLLTCNEDDLKEIGMPEEARQKLLAYLVERRKGTDEQCNSSFSTDLAEYNRSSVTSSKFNLILH